MNSRRQDPCSIRDWLEYTYIQNQITINRQKIGNEPKETEINRQKYENVFIEMSKHLVSFITKTNEAEIEKKVTITAGNKCYHALGKILQNTTHSL